MRAEFDRTEQVPSEPTPSGLVRGRRLPGKTEFYPVSDVPETEGHFVVKADSRD